MTSNSKITLDSQIFSKMDQGNNTDDIDKFSIYDNEYFNTKYGGIKKNITTQTYLTFGIQNIKMVQLI